MTDDERDEAFVLAAPVWLVYWAGAAVMAARAAGALVPTSGDVWRMLVVVACGCALVPAGLSGAVMRAHSSARGRQALLAALAVECGLWWLFLRGTSGWAMLVVAAVCAGARWRMERHQLRAAPKTRAPLL